MKKLNRRNLLKHAGLVSLGAFAGVQVGFGNTVLRGKGVGSNELLIYVQLNGAMDGLNLVPPRTGANYSEYANVLRPVIHIPNSQSLTLNGVSDFGLHPLATGMQSLFNNNKMAIVHATGLLEANRSHFVSTALMEQGVQSTATSYGTGWITRYFNSSESTPANAVIPSLVPSYSNTDAVLGDASVLVMGDSAAFSLNQGHWAWESAMQDTISQIFANPVNTEDVVAAHTLNASQIVQTIFDDINNPYVPENGAVYPAGYFGEQTKAVARLYKANVDLEVAYIQTGGWDTHVNQGTGITGAFADLVQGLSDGLNALYLDLTASNAGKFTIIVQSEFGRRAYENTDQGTDHGYGNPMFVIGDNVNGGFYGQFPGLTPAELFEGDDVAVTTDYRHVVTEVLMRRMGNRYLGHIFPGYDNYSPLGVVSGVDQIPDYDYNFNADVVFKSGFE